jgi:molybdate transport system substrate-binding protein
MHQYWIGVFLIVLLCACRPEETSVRTPLKVAAAASLQDLLMDVNEAFTQQTGVPVLSNFASSGTLAQQVMAAPRVDVFLSASERWMHVVEQAGQLVPGTRVRLWENRLVLVAHDQSTLQVNQLADLLLIPLKALAVGEVEHVPAGRYARQWLEGVVTGPDGGTLWSGMQEKIAPAADVRAALMWAQTRRDVVAIVYATDYKSRANGLKLLYEQPANQEPKIAYFGGLVQQNTPHPMAASYLDFLQSREGLAIAHRHGFVALIPEETRSP